MNLKNYLYPIFIIFLGLTKGVLAQEADLNIHSYSLELEPNIPSKSIQGKVKIQLEKDPLNPEIILHKGNLTIEKVTGKTLQNFRIVQNELRIKLKNQTESIHELEIEYQGNPRGGLLFLPDENQAYTVFSTQRWMPANPRPSDRAKFTLSLIIPDSLTCVANGELKNTEKASDTQTKYIWELKEGAPAYVLGFVIGSFNTYQSKYKETTLNYYATDYSSEKLATIFQFTPDALAFFEGKSGIPYTPKAYHQFLMGNHYQEMAGFAVLKKAYGDLVLKDKTEVGLIAHELAHQWWGNMITCNSWRHFWLNESFAVYLTAAFYEKQFGEEKYQELIQIYKGIYEKLLEKDTDKPLVFEKWSNPTADDRNIVYFKGAYVLHLLREKLGDETFWKGIKQYSQAYYGKSVVTKDFQKVMEEVSQKDLQEFFDEWMY